MTLPNHKDVFQLLLAGILNASIDNWRNTEMPFFQQAINQVACLIALQGNEIPNSFKHWLKLFEKPISTWWPGNIGELDLEPDLRMIYDGQPEDWLIEYFEVRQIDLSRFGRSLTSYQSEIDQYEINSLRQWCRDNNQPDIYSIFREFIIRHPWTNITDLGSFMIQFNIKIPQLIQFFYEEPKPEHYHTGKLWRCPYCDGILRWQFNRPFCVRHNVCSRVTSDYENRQPLNQDPIIPEIRLYDICREIPGIKGVQLWPGYDAYDLRINFINGNAWAIDVKDVSDPGTLRNTIEKSAGNLLATRASDDIGWNQAFYVIPDYRVDWCPGYKEIARSDRFKGIKLVTHSQLLKMVKAHVGQMPNSALE